MPITILAIGKQKEPHYRAAALEYQRRLSRYAKLSVVELADEQDPGEQSEALVQKALEVEGRRILDRIKPTDIVITLEIEGSQLDSLAFSKRLAAWHHASASVCFVIGGSLGLSEEVKQRANERLSLSIMTFPHQLARVMLLEQLYRGYKILSAERYHK